jgi:UDP-N-acetylglucosamine 2-epimerase (non-hydrolysing)
MLRALSVFGTRPEAIKLAPVILEMQKHPDTVTARVCVTGQHRQMLDQVLDLFQIRPHTDLELMQPDQSLPDLTGRIIAGLDTVLAAERPDVVLVQGDTTTVMAAALAAFYRRIPVAHVEAGLRSYDRYSPFPEEMNRRLASVLSTYHFAPTESARQALQREGVDDASIFVTGNTVIDALYLTLKRPLPAEAKRLLSYVGVEVSGPWSRLPGGEGGGPKLILVTAHRRENFGQRLESICQGLNTLAKRNPDVVILYPVHRNPNIREPVTQLLGGLERIILTDPLAYDVLARLMQASTLILTDSGGMQEEAPALGKPVLVLRSETERPEALAAGVAKLVGTDADRIVAEAERLLHDPEAYQQMAQAVSPYGDGHAAERIVRVLLEQVGQAAPAISSPITACPNPERE